MEIFKKPQKLISFDEVVSQEASKYTIQIGDDLFRHEGKYKFSKSAAIKHYNRILDALIYSITQGSEEEKSDALFALSGLRAARLRIH